MGERLFCWAGEGAAEVRAGDAWVVRGRGCDWESLIAEEAVGTGTENDCCCWEFSALSLVVGCESGNRGDRGMGLR